MNDLDIFTEQAEYISGSSFEKWTVSYQEEEKTLRKLTQGGAKLITGPRGCGKTTLMLKAFNKLLYNTRNTIAFPIYVNFKSSLKLEPLYRNNTNAVYWFNQWLLYKVAQGVCDSFSELKLANKLPLFSISKIKKGVSLLEMGRIDLFNDTDDQLTIETIKKIIDKALEITNKTRCVLLLDDAGHAFSTEQQHDFFEFFREIKTKKISPKAAIYPGVTSYSSSFHVGHDAEEIDVWIKPKSTNYLSFMHSLLKSRLPDNIYKELRKEETLLDLICFSSYGIPRTLLNIISKFVTYEDNGNEISLNKIVQKKVLNEIKINFDKTYQIYDSLKLKLPMYKNFIDEGAIFYEKCLTLNKDFNNNENSEKQSSIIAIKRPLSSEIIKVIGFFQYSGLLAPQGISNRGKKGVYELFELHYAAIIDRNVFFSSRGISAEKYLTAFLNRPNHHYPRYTEKGILGDESSGLFTLALPPCESCKANRISNVAKFCVNCGAKLKEASTFDNIVSKNIDVLPITAWRAQSIRENSRISTIKDVLMDHDNNELRSVSGIGPVWAERIHSYAEEYIA